MTNKQRGRPRGSFRPTTTHQVGAWSWNTHQLNARIKQGTGDQCWLWLGNKTPSSNIFGAYKNGSAKMSPANRIIYMEHTGDDVTAVKITMACKNRWCCNPSHFSLAPNNRRYNETDNTES